MSAADCGLCEALGYRTCDSCEGIAWKPGPLGIDYCAACCPELYGDEEEDEWQDSSSAPS